MNKANNYTQKNLFSDGESLVLWEKTYHKICKKADLATFSKDKTLNEALKSRLIQFLAVNGLPELKQFINVNTKSILSARSGKYTSNVDDNFLVTLNGHNLIYKPVMHRVSECCKFLFNWFCCLLAIVSWGKNKMISPLNSATLLYGCAEQNIDSALVISRIENFLNATPIGKVPKSSYYIFKSRKILTQRGQSLVFSRLPDIALILQAKISLRSRFILAISHVFWLFVCLKFFFKRPVLTNFASELGSAVTIKWLAEQGYIDAFVHSTGNVTAHPVSARFFELYEIHSIYYNIVPTNPTLSWDPYPNKAFLDPPLLWSNKGTHWVWTEADKRLMREKYMIRDVEVIGAPSIFYSDFTSKNDQDRSNKYDIVIFDVTPHT